MAKRSKNSRKWLERQSSDPYVQAAQSAGYRSRASFKLLEIDQKYHLFRPGARVLDLGAAPGGWSQIAHQRVGEKGCVIGLDLLEIAPLAGVEFIQSDFLCEITWQNLKESQLEQPFDIVISDLAPNISGIRIKDQADAMLMAELAAERCHQVLKPGGAFLIKVFEGEGLSHYRQYLKTHFSRVRSIKPAASRADSREYYLYAEGFRGHHNQNIEENAFTG